MIILLHSSKTMHQLDEKYKAKQKPQLLVKSTELGNYLKTLPEDALQQAMKVSSKLAAATYDLLQDWNMTASMQRSAVDSFAGDIYSGLQIHAWSAADRKYAQNHLRILSGLYGILRPYDGIYPYRLEMGYRLPDSPYVNLHSYWADTIAKTLPQSVPIVNLAAVEYSKVVTPYIEKQRVITPAFMTKNPKTGEPTFVVVHAKIARGAFAGWLIRNRITNVEEFKKFSELNYCYSKELSTPETPTFVCDAFGGLGLSVRLQHKTS